VDWKIFFATFTSIFLAELADKTQVIGISMSAKSGKPVVVWLASVAAYMLVTVASVAIGSLLASHIKPDIMRYAGGSLFVILGALMFFGKL